MAQDKMIVEVLKGGLIKITTSPISPEEHVNAEEMIKFIARKAGGETITAKRTDGLHEAQTHSHEHEHN